MEEQFLLFGLSDDEAIRIRNAGGGNASPPAMTKSTEQIVRDNLCTLFNLFNLLIALALARIGAWSNLLFILVVALNAVIGIVQELHAKRLIEQISVLTAPRAQVIRSGNRRQVPVAELVLGDILFLDSGVQVPADATLLSGEVEVDESLLTGEAEPVRKSVGSALLSRSVVLSGTCRARVERTGSDSYAARLTQEARAEAPTHSELLSSMRKVTQFTAFFIPPLGIILFLQAVMFRNDPLFDAVTATAAALLGMLPKGLVLLISVSLATGVARLARHNVLVQNLFSLENLAHVDVLCLDKTGTLTEGGGGRMCLERVVPLSSDSSDSLEKWMGAFLAHSDDNNATFQAMRTYFSDSGSQLEPTMKIPFSSQRKWSAMEFKGWGTLVVGAPERMTGTQLPPDMTEAVQRGRRVLMVACTEEAVSPDSNTLPRMRPLAAMVFSDPVRSGAAKTLDYFRREGVAVKVISGDPPRRSRRSGRTGWTGPGRRQTVGGHEPGGHHGAAGTGGGVLHSIRKGHSGTETAAGPGIPGTGASGGHARGWGERYPRHAGSRLQQSPWPMAARPHGRQPRRYC